MDENHDETNSWVLCTRDLHEVVRDLCKYAEDIRCSRKFNDKSECLSFLKRVAAKQAKPIVFKDFPYEGQVEREVWFEDIHVDKGFQFVIVHIHFREPFNMTKHKLRQPQSAQIVESVNLRHYKTTRSEHHKKTGYYESVFKSTYLEDHGEKFVSFKGGWDWKEIYPAEKNSVPET
jgi:hypothetical protein